MMQQYREIKKNYPDTILFFRLGDFYEMFGPDAELGAKVLEIALTGRDAGPEGRVPMCGVPYHAVESYLAKLVDKGYKVAICEQVEDPKLAKGIVRREVIRVVSPGTVMEASMLEEKRNNYLLAVTVDQGEYGLALADISTGEFRITEAKGENAQIKLIDEVARLNPAEILASSDINADVVSKLRTIVSNSLTLVPDQEFNFRAAVSVLRDHFGVLDLRGFGCQEMVLAVGAAGGLLSRLLEQSGGSLAHINKLTPYSLSKFMFLDHATRRNLELTRTLREQDKKGSLLGVLDYTQTAMGGRLLKQWLEQPPIELAEIHKRQMKTEALFVDYLLRSDLRDALQDVYDLERIIGRIVYGTANAKDLLALKHSLQQLPVIKTLLERQAVQNDALADLTAQFDSLADICALLEKSIADDAPFTLREGNLIKTGFRDEIDELRYVAKHGKDWVASLETQEREKTGIKSLKVGFNKVFGYYLEVTRANVSSVPPDYIRKQTLANAERYITPELKEYENKILGAEEKLVALEYQVFGEVREQVGRAVKRIQQSAGVIAQLDVFASLAEAAARNDYVKPVVNDAAKISIVDGRHPVVEKMLRDELFVPNDTELDQTKNRLAIITGPNMAGKSTYMRQVALIVLMAQIGSFVPATRAEIGLVDRIFTRVGASDDLATGQSTFMVEMNEVSNILNSATAKSLIILDEIGRGTATYDGLSIAWAVAEYIHNPQRIGAKTLFATHYHELTELAEILPGVCNYRVAVKEKGDNIVFLRKIVLGSADRSYGIQVARLAGLPLEVIKRAKGILATLESQETSGKARREISAASDGAQLSLAVVPEEVVPEEETEGERIVAALTALNINQLTPLDALNLLAKWRKALSE
ncbi:MAG TPA: DNA mismatch repair protein MutS [Desulfobacteria bacterium]|nr:DNA mismatch repair protein MutS [Desulfobacteria bacterium]